MRCNKCNVDLPENYNRCPLCGAEPEKSEAKLKTIDTENVEEMVHVMPMENVLREDVRVQNFSRESLLEGAPERNEDSWQVPRLVK